MTRNDLRGLITDNSKDAALVWWFNVGLDIDWDREKSGFFPRIETSDKAAVFGMEQIMLMLADENDFVVMRRQPDELICGNVKRTGKGLPKILTPFDVGIGQKTISELILSDGELLAAIGGIAKKTKTYLVPYAITRHEAKIAELTGAELFGPCHERASWANSKINARNISKELKFDTAFGMECHSKEDLCIAFDMIQNEYPGTAMVLKEEYGASGKGLFLIKGRQDWDSLMHRAGKLEKNGSKFNAILEKWHCVRENINYQLMISDSAYLQKNYLFAVSRQEIKDGVYKGSIFLKSDSEMYGLYKPYAVLLGDYLYGRGYRGICNVDSIITEDGLTVPIIEINGRLSLSTYISCLSEIFCQDMAIASAYYDINGKIELSEIDGAIGRCKYDEKSKTGTVVYSFSTGAKRNRLFVLFAYLSEGNINEKKLEFENILENLELKYAANRGKS